MKKWSSTITLTFTDNYHEAESIGEYILLLKEQFAQEYNITLNKDEITDVEYGDFDD